MKKLTIVQKLRKRLKEAENLLEIEKRARAAEVQFYITQIEARIKECDKLEAQRDEARRHTLSMGDGSSINFKPLYVTEYRTEFDKIEIPSISGFNESVQGLGRAKLTVLADMVKDPPIIYLGDKAKVARRITPYIPPKLEDAAEDYGEEYDDYS
jgi:hypothetical protein